MKKLVNRFWQTTLNCARYFRTALVEIIRIQQEQIQELRDEIARLKGQKPKPKIKPSVLEKYFENKEAKKEFKKRHGSTKRENR